MLLKRAVVTTIFHPCNCYIKELCSRNFSPPKLLSDDRAPTIRPHTCWVTAANLLPRHAPTDDYSLPQIAEDTCTALGHHMLGGRMNLCSSA